MNGQCRAGEHAVRQDVGVPGERPGRRPAGLPPAEMRLELFDELAERLAGVHRSSRRQRQRAARPGARSTRSAPRRGRERVDLAQRDPAAKLELERGATRRCLAAVTAIEDEGVQDIVAVRNGEEARPEVVVLALAERRVVPQALAIEDCTIDDHRRMKERGRESAAHRTARAPLGIRCTAPSVPSP